LRVKPALFAANLLLDERETPLKNEEFAMYAMLIGLILLGLKYLEIGPVAQWDWWVCMIPLGVAAAWWMYADNFGYTKKKAMEKMDAKKRDRLAKQKVDLGMTPGRKK
jgi:small Trp-rich protein